jgi:hypothetical protein
MGRTNTPYAAIPQAKPPDGGGSVSGNPFFANLKGLFKFRP